MVFCAVQDGTPAEREWMAQFSRLLYVIERHNTVTRPYLLQTARLGRPKAGSASVQGMPGSHAGAAGVGLEEEEDAGDEETYRKSTSAILRVSGCGRGRQQARTWETRLLDCFAQASCTACETCSLHWQLPVFGALFPKLCHSMPADSWVRPLHLT